MSEVLPWEVNQPLVSVTKEVYKRYPRPGAAALVAVAYVGPAFVRREVHGVEFRDDVHNERFMRFSFDNGENWGEDIPVPSTDVYYQGKELWEGEGPDLYDTETGILVQAWLRQIAVGGLYHNFAYIRQSHDYSQTWSTPRQLRYEPGPDFDPQDPHHASFLGVNEGYCGNNILRHSNGTLIHCLAHANAPGDPGNATRVWRMGSLCFIGRWDDEAGEYDWTPGERVEVSPEVSARGLMEPEVAELRDGRVLVVWRQSTHGWDGSVAQWPGRKLFSISRDGGKTLTSPAEWRYDDGASFYSPSSIHRLIRHSVNGKLYWVGNITATPPVGNSPRYPLVIAEVDDETGRLRKDTVTVIDDRRPGQTEAVQFSNFSLLEDRLSGNLELYLTAYGESPEHGYNANCYKYVLRLAGWEDTPEPPAAAPAAAPVDPARVREQSEWSNNWWDHADDTKLPRVLLIGDSISVGYGPTVIEKLAGVAHVDRLSNSRNTLDPMLLAETRMALTDRRYAAVHFNNGLHGWHLTCEDYERGLRDYVRLLRELAPGTALVGASSTPITKANDPATLDAGKNAVVIRRNEVAATVIAELGLPTNDLYGLVVGHPEWKTGDGYHFGAEGSRALGEAVAEALQRHMRR